MYILKEDIGWITLRTPEDMPINLQHTCHMKVEIQRVFAIVMLDLQCRASDTSKILERNRQGQYL